MKAKCLKLKSETELEFIGEGNEHVVFSIANTGNVVRFRKFPLNCEIGREDLMLRVQEDLSFVNEVARPLGGSLLVDEARIVSVDPLLLRNVMERIRLRRDVKRLNKSVNKFGIGILTTNAASQFVQRKSFHSNTFPLNIFHFSITNFVVSVFPSKCVYSVERIVPTTTTINSNSTSIKNAGSSNSTRALVNCSREDESVLPFKYLNNVERKTTTTITGTTTGQSGSVKSPTANNIKFIRNDESLLIKDLPHISSKASPGGHNVESPLADSGHVNKQASESHTPPLIPYPAIQDIKKICIELKPKQGFLETGPKNLQICRFCLKQHIKIKTQDELKRSLYCPISFFSGDLVRMERALHNLFSSPQNNLKIFCDGERVSNVNNYRHLSKLIVEILTFDIYEQTPRVHPQSPPDHLRAISSINSCSSSSSSSFSSSSSPFFSSSSSPCSPFSSSSPSSSSSRQAPSSGYPSSSEVSFRSIQDHQSKEVNEYKNDCNFRQTETDGQTATLLSKGSSLSPSSFLGRLLLLQIFGNNKEIHSAHLYKELKNRTTSKKALHEALTKFEFITRSSNNVMENKAPKNTHQFPSDFSNGSTDGCQERLKPIFEGKIADLKDRVMTQLIQQCLVAMSAKDASIMILVEGPYNRNGQCGTMSRSSSPFWLEHPSGTSHWYKCQVSLVDVAQKTPDKILEHKISFGKLEDILLDLRKTNKEPACCQNL